jgi:hypothetical protein
MPLFARELSITLPFVGLRPLYRTFINTAALARCHYLQRGLNQPRLLPLLHWPGQPAGGEGQGEEAISPGTAGPILNVFRALKPFQLPNFAPPTLKKFESFP